MKYVCDVCVTMLWRFNGSPSSSDALTQFTDSASVSSYASSAASWAVSGGLLKGDTGAPGTKWEDLPADFECPLCGVGKDQFSAA